MQFTRSNLSVLQRAKRATFYNRSQISAADLLDYCEHHRVTKKTALNGQDVQFIYSMPNGVEVIINGYRGTYSNEEFVPCTWSIKEPGGTIMDHIKGVLSAFHRR